MARDLYRRQVQLLVDVLPLVMEEGASFALKGGTAINLFHRDLPRLSVDIDLVYLPIEPRDETIANIDFALTRIGARTNRLDARMVKRGGGSVDTRARIERGDAAVKIDVSPVMRGTVHIPEVRRTMPSVEDEFGFVEMRVVAFEDLFGGKLVAALDRQHPRDLFDVAGLYAHEGLTAELWRTIEPTTIEALEATRERMIHDVRARLDDATRTFLLTLHDGDPDFGAIGLAGASTLPAIRWKVENLRKLRAHDVDRHAALRDRIAALFERA